MESLVVTTLEQEINKIDFNAIKETFKDVTVEVKNSDWLKSITFEYMDAPTIYDKEGFTYCLKLKQMPFNSWPMRNSEYIQTYKSVKRMLNSLFKSVKPSTEVVGA